MEPKGERLDPVGASDDTLAEPSWTRKECQQCTCLEEEKEMLQTSLFALTTHFAQVQFRLRQVCDAPLEEQEELLRSLEQFAFRDVTLHRCHDDDVMDMVKKWRHQQQVLLSALKSQVKELKDFEKEAKKEAGSVNLLLDHLRVKEDVERQLRTQVADLEQFIECLKSAVCKQTEKSVKNYVIEMFEQMIFMVQFTWGCNCFTVRAGVGHWGDLRAKLELDVIELRRMVRSKAAPERITVAVRRNLAASIRDLMQHGVKSHTHSWDIILYYYDVCKGDEFNSSAVQKLSRSYNIEIAGVSPNRNRKNLLSAVGQIVSMHSRYKRDRDAHFKAFICAALNARRLVSWLHLIFHSGEVIKTFYYPGSYVATTRYEDGLSSLNMLTKYKFNLPVDLDVQKFQVEDAVFI